MPSTHDDQLYRIWQPAVATMLPGEEITRRRRVDRAIGRDGRVLPDAVPVDTNYLSGVAYSNAGASTSSTATYANAAVTTFTLPSGRWIIKAMAATRIGNTLDSNVDGRITITGHTTANEATRSGPSVSAAPMNLIEQTSPIDGDQDITVAAQVKSDTTGTSSMTNVALSWEARRVG